MGLGLVLFFWAVSLLCLFLFPASVSMEVEFVVFGREFAVFCGYCRRFRNALLRCSMSGPDGAPFKEIGALA